MMGFFENSGFGTISLSLMILSEWERHSFTQVPQPHLDQMISLLDPGIPLHCYRSAKNEAVLVSVREIKQNR
jgi:hypothetical protein